MPPNRRKSLNYWLASGVYLTHHLPDQKPQILVVFNFWVKGWLFIYHILLDIISYSYNKPKSKIDITSSNLLFNVFFCIITIYKQLVSCYKRLSQLSKVASILIKYCMNLDYCSSFVLCYNKAVTLIIQFCLIVQFIILSLSAETKQLYNVVFCLDINRHDAGSMVRLYSLRIIPRFYNF